MPGRTSQDTAGGGVSTPSDRAVPASRYQLLLLGTFTLTGDRGSEIVISSRKNRLLLAMLAISPTKSLSRDMLAGALWAGHSEEPAKSSLRQALAGLLHEVVAPGPRSCSVGDSAF